jgi:hypothetical protein
VPDRRDERQQQGEEKSNACDGMNWVNQSAVNDSTNTSYIDRWSSISVSSSRRAKVMSKKTRGRTQSQAPGRESAINQSILITSKGQTPIIMPKPEHRKQKNKSRKVLLPGRFLLGSRPRQSLLVSNQASSIGLTLSRFYSSTNSSEMC